MFFKESKWETQFGVIVTECIDEERTIERLALVMNIVPCRELDLKGQA